MTWVNSSPEGAGLIGTLLLGLLGGGLFLGWILSILDIHIHKNFSLIFSLMIFLLWIGITLFLMISWLYVYEEQQGTLSSSSSKPKILKFFIIYFIVVVGVTALIISASEGARTSENYYSQPNLKAIIFSAQSSCSLNSCYNAKLGGIVKNLDDTRYEKIPIKISLYTDEGVRFFSTYYVVEDINPYESIQITVPSSSKEYDIVKRFNWENISLKITAYPSDFNYNAAKRYVLDNQFKSNSNSSLYLGQFNCGYINLGSGNVPSIITYLQSNSNIRYDAVKIKFLIYDENNVRIDEGSSIVYSIEPNEKVEYIATIKEDTLKRCLNSPLSMSYEILTNK